MMYALTMFPFPPFSWSTAAEWVSELPSIMKCLLSVAREMQICADHISVGAENCSQSDQDLIISIMERESWLRNKTKMYTLRSLYSETLEVQFMFSLSFWKLCLAFNLEYLSHFFINFNNWWQFWNPHDEHITNLSLIFEFHEEITEIIWNEKDETKLIFEKYQLSLTSNISTKT